MFSGEHRARFQELLALGELYALNSNPEHVELGWWEIGWSHGQPNNGGRLKRRFFTAVRSAAIAAGAPPRINLVQWWVSRLVDKESEWRIEFLIRRSSELCEQLEADSLEVPLSRGERSIEHGLRRDRYPCDFLHPFWLYDMPHEPLPDPDHERNYWREHVWEEFQEYVAAMDKGNRDLEAPVYRPRTRYPGEARKAFRDRVAVALESRVAALKRGVLGLSYDLAVLEANYIIDTGLRGEPGLEAFATASERLAADVEGRWHESCKRLGISERKVQTARLDFRKPFRKVANDFSLLLASESSRATHDVALLRGTDGALKRAVNLKQAQQYGGVGRRALERAIKKGALEVEGSRLNRRILVDSLVKYFPPD